MFAPESGFKKRKNKNEKTHSPPRASANFGLMSQKTPIFFWFPHGVWGKKPFLICGSQIASLFVFWSSG